MELKEAIVGRRSVRKFKSDPISRELILEILRQANMAPSAGNQQPWEFIVLESKRIMEMLKITKIAFAERFDSMEEEELEAMLSRLSIPDEDSYAGLRRFYSTMGGAPVVIIAITKRGKDEFSWLKNCASTAAAVQNLLLAAWDKGLGTCWMMGPLQKKEEQLKDLFKVPEDKMIVAIIPVGVPEKRPASPVKESVENKVRWDIVSK